ncbi:hypothetical protein C8R44DRAFT_725284 [Mycena epipterygia]|nr:hypothetical protein C8R44DRAFT_725284 [Mycena epipterygia]
MLYIRETGPVTAYIQESPPDPSVAMVEETSTHKVEETYVLAARMKKMSSAPGVRMGCRRYKRLAAACPGKPAHKRDKEACAQAPAKGTESSPARKPAYKRHRKWARKRPRHMDCASGCAGTRSGTRRNGMQVQVQAHARKGAGRGTAQQPHPGSGAGGGRRMYALMHDEEGGMRPIDVPHSGITTCGYRNKPSWSTEARSCPINEIKESVDRYGYKKKITRVLDVATEQSSIAAKDGHKIRKSSPASHSTDASRAACRREDKSRPRPGHSNSYERSRHFTIVEARRSRAMDILNHGVLPAPRKAEAFFAVHARRHLCIAQTARKVHPREDGTEKRPKACRNAQQRPGMQRRNRNGTRTGTRSGMRRNEPRDAPEPRGTQRPKERRAVTHKQRKTAMWHEHGAGGVHTRAEAHAPTHSGGEREARWAQEDARRHAEETFLEVAHGGHGARPLGSLVEGDQRREVARGVAGLGGVSYRQYDFSFGL